MEERKGTQAPCIRCGEMTDNKLADVFICQACYEIRSSCCPEFGPDDLAENACGVESESTTKNTKREA